MLVDMNLNNNENIETVMLKKFTFKNLFLK